MEVIMNMNKKILINIFALAAMTVGCVFAAEDAPIKSVQDLLKEAFANRRPVIDPDDAVAEKTKEEKITSEKPKIEGAGKGKFEEMKKLLAGQLKPHTDAVLEIQKTDPVKVEPTEMSTTSVMQNVKTTTVGVTAAPVSQAAETTKVGTVVESYHKKYILRLIGLLKQDITDEELLGKVAELEKGIEVIDQEKLSKFNQQRLMIEALFVDSIFCDRRLNILPMTPVECSESIFVALGREFIGQDMKDWQVLPQRYYDIQQTQGCMDFFGWDNRSNAFRKKISDVQQSCLGLAGFYRSIILPIFDLYDQCREIAMQFNNTEKHISKVEFDALKNEIYQALILLRSIKADKSSIGMDDCFIQTLINMLECTIGNILPSVE
jgi:hypothetical protein